MPFLKATTNMFTHPASLTTKIKIKTLEYIQNDKEAYSEKKKNLCCIMNKKFRVEKKQEREVQGRASQQYAIKARSKDGMSTLALEWTGIPTLTRSGN